LQPFRPLFRNPHIATIAANFAQRRMDLDRFPVSELCLPTSPDVQVLIRRQFPQAEPRAHLVMVHGLEGSSEAGYMRSMSQLALEQGFATNRTNLRSCGGTESLANTMYHAGLTSDTLAILQTIKAESHAPIFLIGYSLGGNISLKLAGELALAASNLLAGVIAVSTPIDLGACVRKMSQRENWIYEWRFLTRLKQRIRERAKSMPGHYDLSALDRANSVYEFDDRITAQHFGFGSADNYYNTQSSIHFLHRIALPTLLVQAQDDPLIPFDLFGSDAVTSNPSIALIAPEHGGHLGFIADRPPRFWVDRVILHWVEKVLASQPASSNPTSTHSLR
jgi:uncharacterized protein